MVLFTRRRMFTKYFVLKISIFTSISRNSLLLRAVRSNSGLNYLPCFTDRLILTSGFLIKEFKNSKLQVMGQPHKMVKHTHTIRWQKPTNCLSVFDHFVRLTLKGLKSLSSLFLFFTKKFLLLVKLITTNA